MISDFNRSIAAHVLVTLAHAQSRGRAIRLDELATEIGVRRPDVRETVARLHREGHVDALRLRLTMTGLALAATLDGCKIKEPRRTKSGEFQLMPSPPSSTLRVA
jgi:hypothetical protein